MKKNHLATAEDFKKLAEKRLEEAERITLPSGLEVMLRRLPPQWLIFRGKFPGTLAENGSPSRVHAPDLAEVREMGDYILQVLGMVMVAPKVALTPKNGEVSPELISDEDLSFILRYGLGEVAPGGSDLKTFRGQRKPAAAGTDG